MVGIDRFKEIYNIVSLFKSNYFLPILYHNDNISENKF